MYDTVKFPSTDKLGFVPKIIEEKAQEKLVSIAIDKLAGWESNVKSLKL